jgi:hypothetical protein
MLFSGRLKLRCNGGNTVTLADRGGEHVGDEEADGLRLLNVVGAVVDRCSPRATVA